MPAHARAAVTVVAMAALLATAAGDAAPASDRTSGATDARAARGAVGLATRPAARAAARAERLRFVATWNALPVADAELLIQPAPDGTLVLRGRAATNEVLDLLWSMRDSFEATVGLAPTRPRRFVLRQNENDRRRETTVVADGPRLVGTIERRNHRTRRAVVPLGPRLHDPASVAIAIRTLPDRSATTSYDVLAGTKLYTVTVAPAGAETIEVAGRNWSARRYRLSLDLTPRDAELPPTAGTPPAAVHGASASYDAASYDVSPAYDASSAAGPSSRPRPSSRPHASSPNDDGRDLKVQDADLWISAGPERVPLRMRAQTFWGWVTVELVGRGAPRPT